ncbi:MAG TPA: hypothetical protein VHQ45_08855 [Gemmatimonadaceae bacterium]|jgi:hypothetical protein|nr:hypothetical protein [Gemmatimonadaceae bacterium]
MPDYLLLRRPLVEEFLERLATFTVDDWRQLGQPAYEQQPAYLAAMERVFEAMELVGPEVLAFLTQVDERIDRLWRRVEGDVRQPTSTDLTGDFPWLMAKTAVRALLLRHVAGLGAAGFEVLHAPFVEGERARALQSLLTNGLAAPDGMTAPSATRAPHGRNGVQSSHEHANGHTDD